MSVASLLAEYDAMTLPASPRPPKSTRVLGLTATSGEQTATDLVAAWALANNEIVLSHKVIRAIGNSYTIKVETSEVGELNELDALSREWISYDRDRNLTPFGIATLKDRYLLPGETSPQEAFMRAAVAFADDAEHAKRLYDYVSKAYFMYSTPVLSNAPKRTGWGAEWKLNFIPERFDTKKRGLPISCFLNYTPDSREGLTEHYAENAWLSSLGGGIGGFWGAIRSNGTETKHGSRSSGMLPFLKVVDSEVMAFAQGVTRRASYAAYTDIAHPEIVEFLEMRKPTGGDANRKCLNLHHAVNIPDAFMEIIEACMKDEEADDSWPLVDPHTHKVVEMVSAKDLWQRILELRVQTGEPYINFIDTANRALPKAQRDAGLRVHQSNLCTEITLPTNEQRTAVCCLSSVNLEAFDEWSKLPLFIEDLVRMLDNVIEYFIQNAPDKIAKAKFSASQERSIGIGAMGFHSYLQLKGIRFESALATALNRQVFSHIKGRAMAATRNLAEERGPCPDAKGEMRRNMHLLAVAPNASSAILCGETSEGIEPYRGNAITRKTQSGSWLVKNKHLEEVLTKHGRNDEDTWTSIITTKGSVQHLDFLSQEEKDLFKTAMELDQRWIIEHAHHRQEYICQAQSVNLFMPADVQVAYLHHVHFRAWKAGLKSLYYLRSETIKRADTISAKNGTDVSASGTYRVTKEELLATEDVCLSCQG